MTGPVLRPKLWNGASPAGEGESRALERIDAPYLTSVGIDHVAHKKGHFREVHKTGEEDILFVDGLRKKRGAYQRASTGSPHYKRSFSQAVNFSGEYTDMWQTYIGQGRYICFETRYLNEPMAPSALVYYTAAIGINFVAGQWWYDGLLSVGHGRRRAHGDKLLVVDGYDIDYTAFESDPRPVVRRWGLRCGPSRYGGEDGVRAFVTFGAEVGSTDRFGRPLADIAYGETDGTEDGSSISLLPRGAVLADKPLVPPPTFTVIEPGRWIVMVGALYAPTPTLPPPSGYTGGHLAIYRTDDAGENWSVATPAALQVGQPASPSSSGTIDYRRYSCALNTSLAIATEEQVWCVLTPEILLLAYPYFGVAVGEAVPVFNAGTQDSAHKPQFRLARSADSGATFANITLPPLLEPNPYSGFKLDSNGAVALSMVYLGRGVVLLSLVGFGPSNQVSQYFTSEAGWPWNLLRSTDYGETWEAVPKVGLPESVLKAEHVGRFKVLEVKRKKGTVEKPGLVVLPVWGGEDEGFVLYASKDDGSSWQRASRLTRSDAATPMGANGDVEGIQWINSFSDVTYAGTRALPAPVSVETPWRFDEREQYEVEE